MSLENAIPLLDLQIQHRAIAGEIAAAIGRVVDSQRFILGPEVVALEEAVAGYCGATHAIGCASGSDAILLALQALDVGRIQRRIPKGHHDTIIFESQILCSHEVELVLHRQRHDDEEGRHGELQDEEPPANVATATCCAPTSQGVHRVEA